MGSAVKAGEFPRTVGGSSGARSSTPGTRRPAVEEARRDEGRPVPARPRPYRTRPGTSGLGVTAADQMLDDLRGHLVR